MLGNTKISSETIEKLPLASIIYNENFSIKMLNTKAQKAIQLNREIINHRKLAPLLKKAFATDIPLMKSFCCGDKAYQFFFSRISEKDKNYILVSINSSWPLQQDYERYKEESEDLKAIFESIYDVLYVSDHKGNTLRVSAACKHIWGVSEEQLVGKNVLDLEKEGVYQPSITRLVLENKKKISTVQSTKNNKRLLVVGTPIKNKQGEIIRVVNASRDITDISNLQQEIQQLKCLINEYQRELSKLQNDRKAPSSSLVYKSKKLEAAVKLAKRVAAVDSTVLILGETGVGKEVFANFIHEMSYRKNKPFIKINCSAIPENLLESELFGYEKGAFTGANREGKKGLLELANHGTLLLDEIGDMPLSLQIKLLRVIQERTLQRIGSTKAIHINVRFIAATHRDLAEEVDIGKFRQDLYYRLNVIPIHLPPLRERKEDILSLATHFLTTLNNKYHTSKTFNSTFTEKLTEYEWPGNIRELQNVVERSYVMSDSDDLTSEILAIALNETKKSKSVLVKEIMPLKECVEFAEKELLQMAFETCKTTVEMAKLLEVNQSTISRKIAKYNIR
ncbi:sigma-54 interaction domain-containing protein [Lysinibacillus sp. FSL W8-0992]|uniref:sigma-54 interaction domain-containing protein n=1 Tax=Lysinibacillus sp. FSL W8-0992 TaxID=2954643 RepID=UPI0030F9D675